MDESQHIHPRKFRPERHEGDGQTDTDNATYPDLSQQEYFTFGLEDGIL
jgi:hypothetical protein